MIHLCVCVSEGVKGICLRCPINVYKNAADPGAHHRAPIRRAIERAAPSRSEPRRGTTLDGRGTGPGTGVRRAATTDVPPLAVAATRPRADTPTDATRKRTHRGIDIKPCDGGPAVRATGIDRETYEQLPARLYPPCAVRRVWAAWTASRLPRRARSRRARSARHLSSPRLTYSTHARTVSYTCSSPFWTPLRGL